MRRIIGTIGATLAIVAAVATPAAAQDRDRGQDREDHSRSFYATSVAGETVLEGTTVKLKAEAAGGNDTVDVAGLDNILASDGNLNPGTPQIVGSAYLNGTGPEIDTIIDTLGRAIVFHYPN
jgi:hypothetical protein